MRLAQLAFLLAGFVAWAQAPTGAIEGAIADPSGAAVANATVTVTESATGRGILLKTNALGRYSARNLLPGLYSVKIEVPGFFTAEILDISVTAGSVINETVTLKLGRVQEVVTATASPLGVDAARQTLDTVITEKEIRNMPLFSRNLLDLAGLAPGILVRDASAIWPGFSGETVAYRAVGISGRSGIGTRVQIDGIDTTFSFAGSTAANISSDAVHEFQVSRSSLDVSAPMTSSGTVSIISKSGSNEFHGGGFWDYYNQEMGARLQYNKKSLPFHRKRLGGSAGGPFIKEKLFWFGNWERSYQREQLISSLVEFPQLNTTQSIPIGIRYAKGRLDWNRSPATRLFYSFQHDSNLATTGTAAEPLHATVWANVHMLALELNQSRSTHSFRFGYVNFNSRLRSNELNLKFLRTPQGLPYYLGVGSFQLGPSILAPQAAAQSSLQNSYHGSLFQGRHTLRYGASVQRLARVSFAALFSRLQVNGTYNLSTAAQIRARGGNVEDPLEYPFESFMTGTASAFLFLATGRGYPHGAHYDTRTSWYAADTIRVNRRLSFNLGVRWEYDTGYFSNDRRVRRDPALETWIAGASQFPKMPKDLFSPSFGFAYDPAGTGKTVIRGGFYKGYEPNVLNNLDETNMLPPGIGIATSGHTAVRGPDGAAINVDGRHPAGNYSELQGQPIRNVIGLIGEVHRAFQASYAAFPFDPTRASVFTLSQGQSGPFVITPGNQYKIPYALQFNIGFQRELKTGMVLSADYVQNRGVRLPILAADYERRRDAGTLNILAARGQWNRVLGGRTVDNWIAANPGANISSFGLIDDIIWQGVTSDFIQARMLTGGFTRYRALQLSLRSSPRSFPILREASYLVSYTMSRNEATSGHNNVEFFDGGPDDARLGAQFPRDNRNWNSRETFGPNGLDFTHSLSAAAGLTVPGGFHLFSRWTFVTASPQTLTVPDLGGAISGEQGLFGIDLNGDGSVQNMPRPDVLPGLSVGQYGRKVKSFQDLNRILRDFNQNFAGNLTPHGHALVNAGFFTEAQLNRLGAVIPPIPLVPEMNPNPFHNLLVTDLRLDRPIKLARLSDRLRIRPFADFLNLFNHAPAAQYSGLGATFGALNFDYANAPAGQQASDLNRQRGRRGSTRRVQIGVRFDF